MIRPGEEVHFVALLDEKGETLATVPMANALKCPDGAENVEVSVSLKLLVTGKGSR